MKLLNKLVNRYLGIGILFMTVILLTPNNVVTEIGLGNITVNSEAYADAVMSKASRLYEFGENALGPPDGLYAIVSLVGYEEAYLTLDMGEGEDIVDRSGMDFKVVAQGGRYIVLVGDPDQPLKRLGDGSGNKSFDLASVNLFNARYIQIQFLSGADVEIDAIEAINYITGDIETENPRIAGPKDFWIWENQTSIKLTWKTFDATPENYSILINDELANSELWYGSDITYEFSCYEFSWPPIGEIQVTIILYDAFGNHAEDSVTIEIRPLSTTTPSTSTPISTTTTTPTTVEMNYLVLVLLLGIAFALVWRRLILRRR